MFEPVSRVGELTSVKNFQNHFFTLTAEKASQQTPGQEYDIIIVGSGIGGGVLANDLYATNQKLGAKGKRILLLEKGGLVFHSHCLNNARPSGLANDHGQQADAFFANFKGNYRFADDLDPWKGGPMYNLGGRSAVWGLFAPRIHDHTLENYFHEDVAQELKDEYYGKAEALMRLSLPQTKTVHQQVIDRLNIEGLEAEPHSGVQWQWGHTTSGSRDERGFDSTEGAYSTIDKLLEIAMSKPKAQGGDPGEEAKPDYFKIVLGAEVRSLKIDRTGSTPVVTGVNFKTSEGQDMSIDVKTGGKVVLCAGSVDSPAILLRSDAGYTSDHGHTWEAQIKRHGGLKLTDHGILYYSCPFRFRNPADRAKYRVMKLQTYVDLGGDKLALANMSIDASSFLPGRKYSDEELPRFIMVFILESRLMDGNSISIDPNTGEPTITVRRGEAASISQTNRMRNLTAAAMESLKSTMEIEFIGYDKNVRQKDIKFTQLGLGAVAHELGTLPMASPSPVSCLDHHLTMKPALCSGVYVCDLSIFPYSPEASPALTLAALAIRLSRRLNPRHHVVVKSQSHVHVVNHSSSTVKVWLSAVEGPSRAGADRVILKQGGDHSWERRSGTAEGLFVYKLDLSKPNEEFLNEPIIIVAQPGKVTALV